MFAEEITYGERGREGRSRLERKEGYCAAYFSSVKPAEGPARVSAHTWDFGQNEDGAAVLRSPLSTENVIKAVLS